MVSSEYLGTYVEGIFVEHPKYKLLLSCPLILSFDALQSKREPRNPETKYEIYSQDCFQDCKKTNRCIDFSTYSPARDK